MKRVAIYARSSPDCPLSEDEQIDHLRKIAAERGWTVIKRMQRPPDDGEEGSGSSSRRIGADRAIRSGAIDTVLIWSIDRIGKSLVELVGFMETCRLHDVSLWVEEQRLDTATSNGMSLFDLSTMMASHLRQSRRDRILRGQAAARSLSIRFGRPPLTKPKVEKAKQFLTAGKGVREIARLAGISPASVSRIKTSMNAEVAGNLTPLTVGRPRSATGVERRRSSDRQRYWFDDHRVVWCRLQLVRLRRRAKQAKVACDVTHRRSAAPARRFRHDRSGDDTRMRFGQGYGQRHTPRHSGVRARSIRPGRSPAATCS